jgi:hypothetical protein
VHCVKTQPPPLSRTVTSIGMCGVCSRCVCSRAEITPSKCAISSRTCTKTPRSFSHVCPEPGLVKRSALASKKAAAKERERDACALPSAPPSVASAPSPCLASPCPPAAHICRKRLCCFLRRFQAKSRALYQDRLGPRSKQKKRKEKKRKEKRRHAAACPPAS